MQVGQAGDGDGRRREAEVLGHPGDTGPTTDPVATSGGSRDASTPGGADQHVVVGERRQRAVVGQPGAGHRGVAGRRHAREPHRQVVDRLQQPPGPGDDVGLLVLEEEDVADRVVARDRRDPTAATQPRGQRLRRVAGDRSADGRSRVRRPAGVAPQHARSDRPTRLVHRDRAGPLAGDADGHDPREVGGPRGAAYGLADHLPPLLGVLRLLAAGAGVRRHRRVLPPDDLAAHRDEPDLGPTRAEVDGEDQVPGSVGHAGGRACCLSSMSSITATMKSEVAWSSPPATPP